LRAQIEFDDPCIEAAVRGDILEHGPRQSAMPAWRGSRPAPDRARGRAVEWISEQLLAGLSPITDRPGGSLCSEDSARMRHLVCLEFALRGGDSRFCETQRTAAGYSGLGPRCRCTADAELRHRCGRGRVLGDGEGDNAERNYRSNRRELDPCVVVALDRPPRLFDDPQTWS
jgi:hypothetical protein